MIIAVQVRVNDIFSYENKEAHSKINENKEMLLELIIDSLN
jgi:hypothetical protein